jgi:hypothetical protein
MPRVLNAHGRGWTTGRLPPNSVYVGRWTRPIRISSDWRNRFKVRENGPREEVKQVIARYRAWLCGQPELIAALPELRGKDLICWCVPDSCHADVLLELANP